MGAIIDKRRTDASSILTRGQFPGRLGPTLPKR